MNLSRITRLIELLGLLQSGSGLNAAALALSCGVSRRTVFRDLETLRLAGVPLAFDEELGEYRIPRTYFLPPTNFTAEEALAVMVLCYELGGAQGQLPFCAPARRAAMKLESCLPARLRDHLRQVTGAIDVRLPPTTRLEEQTRYYDSLLAAVSGRRCVRITYRSLSEQEVIRTRLSPYRLLFSRHSWYCIGRSSLHRSTRTFNLSRIEKLELLDDRYRIPRGFSIERFLGNAWHLIPEPGPDREVHVRFAPMVAQNVAEVCWHKSQRVDLLPDGRLDYRVTVSGLKEISWWILGYGDQAEVIAPENLRDMVRQRVERLAEIYRAPRPEIAVPLRNGAQPHRQGLL